MVQWFVSVISHLRGCLHLEITRKHEEEQETEEEEEEDGSIRFNSLQARPTHLMNHSSHFLLSYYSCISRGFGGNIFVKMENS